MEDDTVMVSRRPTARGRGRELGPFALVALLGALGVMAPRPGSAAGPAAPARLPLLPAPRTPSLSPLPPLSPRSPAQALPPAPGPLYAQAEAGAPPPEPGAQNKAEDDKAAEKAGAKPAALGDKCRADGDCPEKAVCLDGVCQRPGRRVSALIYYQQLGPAGYRVLVPFYFSVWGSSKWTQVLVPFFGRSRDSEKKSADLVLPLLLYQYHREPGATSHRIWPVFFYSDYGKQGSALGILPLFYGSRRGTEKIAVLPPLLTFYRGDPAARSMDLLSLGLTYFRRRGDTSTLVLPPLLSFYHTTKEGGFGTTLLLGWYKRSKDETSAGLFPLAWYFGGKEGHTTVVLPLFYESKDRAKGRSHVTLLPIFHYRREEEGKRQLLITPLGGGYRDRERNLTVAATLVPPLIVRDEPARRTTVLPPLAMWLNDRQIGRHAGYAGPVFWSLDRGGTTAGLAPLFFHFSDRKAHAQTDVLLPIFALHRGPGRFFGALGPVYAFGNNHRGEPGASPSRGFGIFPFLFAASGRVSYGLVLPVFAYHRDQDAGTRHLSLGPLFLRQRERGPEAGYDAGLLPLLFVGRRGGASYQALLPVFLHSKSAVQEQVQVGPLYVSRRFAARPGDPEAGVSGALFPLLWFKHTAAQSYGVVPPLLWLGRDGQRWSAGVLPLLTFVRSGPEGKLAFGPGFFYQKDRRGTSLVVGPYAHFGRPVPQEEGGGWSSTHAILPLAFFHSSPRRSAQVIFPLFLQTREQDTTVRSVALLYWGVSRKDLHANVLLPVFGRVVSDVSSTTVVGPAFYHHRFDGKKSAAGLLPLFGYGRDEKATIFGSVLGFYHRDHQAERTRTSFLLFYGDLQKGRADWGLIPLLFGWRRGTATSVLAPLFFHSEDPAQRRSLTVIGPLFFGRTGDATHGGLAPFFFGKNYGDGGYRFTAVPLFHLDHRGGKDERTRFFTALFGFSKDATGFRAYLGPAYLRRDGEMASEALLPIFYHGYNRLTQSRTLLVLPLLFRATTPQTSLTVVTPLLWQYSSLTRRTLLAFPVAIDDHVLFQSRLTAVGPLVPLFIRSRNYAENTTTWVFPPLLTYVKRHAEGHDAAVFPIFWHFRGNEKTTSVLLPIYGYVRRPDYRAAVGIPFIYYRDEAAKRSTAVFLPVFYHRSSPDEQSTVALPLFWYTRKGADRLVVTPLGGYERRDNKHRTLWLNTYVWWGFGPRQGAWGFHFWPLFSVGRPRRGDLEWNVLGGFVGYSRLGVERTLRLLWFIPVTMEPVGRRSAWYGASLRMSGAREW